MRQKSKLIELLALPNKQLPGFVSKYGAIGQKVCAKRDPEAPPKAEEWIHSDEPEAIICQNVVAFAYYKRIFQEGHLLPADDKTAALVGMSFQKKSASPAKGIGTNPSSD